MNITIYGLNQKTKSIGSSKDCPIPHIGERIEVGYTPPPLVIEVVYNYELNEIMVIVDGIIL